MNLIRRTLTIDPATDARLRDLAAERGQDEAAVLAEAVALLNSVGDIAGPDIEEDRQRLQDFKRTRAAIPLHDVKAWVESWGTDHELPRPRAATARIIRFSPAAAIDLERVREFLDVNNPEASRRALRTIFAALERVQEFQDIGRPTEDADIRQIVIPFGGAGYIVRYTILTENGDVLVLRLWHGREARK